METEEVEEKSKNMGEIVLYQPDEITRLEVRIENETVWLTQAQMVDLFQRDRTVITKHINNVFRERELDEKSNVHFLHIANSDKPIKTYSLDVIISVGYRVKSLRGTDFRKWATSVLRKYILNGFVVNQRISRLEDKIVEHDYKFDLLLKISQQQEGLFQHELQQVKYHVESIMADYNDINEDTRMQLELVNEALAELQVKNKPTQPRIPIGFCMQEEGNNTHGNNGNTTNPRSQIVTLNRERGEHFKHDPAMPFREDNHDGAKSKALPYHYP